MRIEGTPEEPKLNKNLKGLEKFPKATESAEDVGDAALGSLTNDPKGILRGLEKFPSAESVSETEAVHEITPGVTIIQRDSGTPWEIEGVREVKSGKVVNLVIRKDGEVARRLTLNYDDLDSKLRTDGNPWVWS